MWWIAKNYTWLKGIFLKYPSKKLIALFWLIERFSRMFNWRLVRCTDDYFSVQNGNLFLPLFAKRMMKIWRKQKESKGAGAFWPTRRIHFGDFLPPAALQRCNSFSVPRSIDLFASLLFHFISFYCLHSISK